MNTDKRGWPVLRSAGFQTCSGVWTFFARQRANPESVRGWNLSAQGCEERATLGGQCTIENNPERVESKDRRAYPHTMAQLRANWNLANDICGTDSTLS